MNRKQISRILLCLAMVFGLCACAKMPTWQEQYDLGIRYLSEGNYQEAIIAFTAAIEIDPKQAPAYVGRGDAYIGFGETAENLASAQADYEKAIELDETNADAYLGLADVYVQQGEYEKAEEFLRSGIERVEENQEIADKLAEVEELAAEKEELSEEDTTGSVGETIDLRDMTVEYTTEPEAFAGNEGAVGAMVISAIVNGPSNVRDVLIASWYLDEPPAQKEINGLIGHIVPMWKEDQESNPSGYQNGQVPFVRGQGHPITPEELGRTAYVVMIGLDENMDAVGYAIVEEHIPA